MPRTSLRALTRAHLAAGDDSAKHAERMAVMAVDPRRIATTVRLTTLLHGQLGSMTREEVGSDGSRNGWPRMNLRQIGNQIYGTAHGWHCHSGVYRTRGAHDLLTGGGLTLDGHAVVHCEHTLPSSLMVDLMWRMRQAGDLALPGDLLAWLLSNSVVTVALQSERKAKDDEPVALGRRRTIGGRTSSWSCTHPDLGTDDVMTDAVRPFVRYVGTGAEIIHVPSGTMVDLQSTMADHRARVADCPVHAAASYGLPTTRRLALAA